MKKKMYEKVVDDSNSILRIDCRNYGAYYLIGCAMEKLNQLEEAIDNFSLVI
jgi:hypothetical protein